MTVMASVPVLIPATITVRDFAAKLGLPITTVVAELLKNGVMASVNQEIDFDTAAIIAEDLGQKIAAADTETPAASLSTTIDYLAEDPKAKLVARPPVVVVLGHVDHGKTSLLDTIRQTDVAGGEAGGITQHIGAYQVRVQHRLITFIDTPGHEAFSQMRSRGAKIADVAILVVAAEEGLKPQTKESLEIIQSAGVPYMVALTKVDKPEANPERVKKELADQNVLAEDFGGKVPFVQVSAKQKLGINELLESVLLLADVESSKLKVDPTRPAVGTIIESHVDPQQGSVCSALVQTGTLRVGDELIVGSVWGKIRSMKNDRGELLKAAPPSTAVQILGLKAAPQVGDIFRVDAKAAQEMKKKTKSHQLGMHARSVVSKSKPSATSSDEDQPDVAKLLIILKTDTLGSAEAILELLKKIQHPEVAVEIVQRGLGIISDAEVLRAEGAKAVVLGFHVPVSPKADQLARSKGVVIETHDIIYELIDSITQKLESMLKPAIEVEDIGVLQILAIFRTESSFQVIGGKVLSGKMVQGAPVRLERNGKEIGQGKIGQLQSNKENTKEVTEGSEAGLKIEGASGLQVGDRVITTITTSRARKLTDRA